MLLLSDVLYRVSIYIFCISKNSYIITYKIISIYFYMFKKRKNQNIFYQQNQNNYFKQRPNQNKIIQETRNILSNEKQQPIN